MRVVYVPSGSLGDELVARGLDRDKIAIYPCEIDIEHFNPSRRNGFFQNRFGIHANDLILLYVGHISKESNLPILVNTFRKLTTTREGLHLVVIGDGPYLAGMKEALKDFPVTFTGLLNDDELAQAYASSDIFISPSSADIRDNVVFEAQASGIPVIVTDEGNPKKYLICDITGVVVPADNSDALIDTVIMLADNPERLQKMKQDARKYIEYRFLEVALGNYQTSNNPK
jgi:glycosyltransferase involved in cell wall biosynthesis